MKKKATKKKVKKMTVAKIDIDQYLLRKRELFLNEEVTNESIIKLIKAIRVLDTLNHRPIYLWICSGGGSVADGLALINIMHSVKSKIITIVNSRVCSMGSHIAIAGDKRIIYENGTIMFHDMTTGMIDYSLKIKDRAYFLEKYYKILENNMRRYTKLSETEIKKARTGEVWLFADDCLNKGVVDNIIS